MRTPQVVAAAAVLGVVAAGLAGWAGLATRHPDRATATATTRQQVVPPTFAVDETLAPVVESVPGLHEGEPPRPVGRLVTGGTPADLVLDELVVTAPDQATLRPVLDRWHATVADQSDGAYLLRLDPSTVDTSTLAADLAKVEPGLSGETAANSRRTLQLVAALAAESAAHGTVVAPNWITNPETVQDGRSIEGVTNKPNAFDWSFLRTGGSMDTGVSAAWQLLEERHKTGNKVRIMVDDGGFVDNRDFPAAKTIRKAKWGDGHRFGWHGTNTALAAMGQLDNEFGTAGPAGQVGELVAVAHADGSWDAFKQIRDIVDEERPAILNMSWTTETELAQSATRAAYDRFLKQVRDHGVLAFAAAGNDHRDVDAENCIGSRCWEGRLVYPCESDYVICVGGLDADSAWKAPDSNYGRDTGNQTVEIYGPYYTVGLANPSYPGTKTVAGTSFASPFVAGVAAMVKAADPALDRDGIWRTLRDTAHRDGVGLPGVVDGNRLRIDALDAVARALGVEQTAPQVRIDRPTAGRQLTPGAWVDLAGAAVDFKGTVLPIAWTVDGRAVNGRPSTLPSGTELTGDGEHLVAATAVDVNGRSTTATVKVSVVRPAPAATILAPLAGEQLYGSTAIDLFGESEDPATHTRLPEAAVSWTVRRVSSAGKVVHTAAGHAATIPAGTLAAGAYQVELTADNGTAVTVSRTFTVLAAPPGHPPVVKVLAPAPGAQLGSGEGRPAPVQLRGRATDAEDGQLPGTRFRWTAIDERQHRTVLCEGSAVPGAGGPVAGGGPVLVTPRDCATVAAELPFPPGTGWQASYTLRLEVWDGSGTRGVAQVPVVVVPVVK